MIGHCPALRIEGDAGALQVVTPHGRVRTRNVIVATNGYTGTLTPWLRRRVIPIGSYIIATEPLAPALMARLLPTDRVVTDSRRVVYYYPEFPRSNAHPVRRARVARRDESAHYRAAPAS